MNVNNFFERWIKLYSEPVVKVGEFGPYEEPRPSRPKLRVHRLRPEAKLPVRAHPTDAGIDLFYCPDTTKKRDFWSTDEKRVVSVYAQSTVVLSTGIKVEVPEGYMLEIKNKSGIAVKKRLIVGACVVDSGYDGEVFVNLHNIGKITQTILPGDKIAQAVLVPIVCCEIEEVEEDVLNQGSSRGDGALGSTGER